METIRSYLIPSFNSNSFWIFATAIGLILLFGGDIMTTVAFTKLGLPEANQFLAPIAGSVGDQIIYKTPYVVSLFITFYGVSKLSDWFIPGTGVFPCMLLLAIFSVPVVWNYSVMFA